MNKNTSSGMEAIGVFLFFFGLIWDQPIMWIIGLMLAGGGTYEKRKNKK